MKKKSYLSLSILAIFLFLLLSISSRWQKNIKEIATCSVFPLWKNFNNIQIFASSCFKKEKNEISSVEKNLQFENQILKIQKQKVYEWLLFDQRIEEMFEKLKKTKNGNLDNIYWRDFFRRREEDLKNNLEKDLQAVFAEVVFRSCSSWDSSLWINIGKKTNDSFSKLVIGKNSPVVVGGSLVGIVEYVGKTASRVRLISDSGLVSSVRAVRGSTQDNFLAKILKSLLDMINLREDLFEDEKEKKELISSLSSLTNKLQKKTFDFYLAKGEVYGESSSLWRSFKPKLKGRGFNYHFEDLEGPSRDLKTGKPLTSKYEFLSMAILKKGDLLVTTGMDGVFPKGLKVAIVSKVKNLKEGSYFYDIEAIPCVRNLHDLKYVFILPPLEFEKN